MLTHTSGLRHEDVVAWERRIVIRGVRELRPLDATIIPDRIEAATFLAAAAITGGSITLERCDTGHLAATLPDSDAGIDGITAVAFSPDGKTLATGDDTGSIYLWDVG